MTSRPERNRFTAVWVLAPVTACAFSLATAWALDHDPLAASASTPTAVPPTATATPGLRALEAKVVAATRRYETTRLALLDVERRTHAAATQLTALRKSSHAAGGTASAAGGSAAYVAPSSPSLPVAAAPAPAAPPVSTTTGAS